MKSEDWFLIPKIVILISPGLMTKLGHDTRLEDIERY